MSQPRYLTASALFDRETAVPRFRLERLANLAGYLSQAMMSSSWESDDYLWDKLRAAEADARRELHVFLEPTVLFPNDPTPAEIDALQDKPWAVDPGYDLDPDMLQPGGWSFLRLRQKPVIAIESIKFSYPSTGVLFSIPPQWIKLDKKYGHVRFVPAGSAFTYPMGGMMLRGMGMQSAPQFIEVRYTAGLRDVPENYPDLLDVVQRMAMLRILGDAAIAASTSISADGLSQSVSAPDLDKMQAGIDRMLGTLRERINGIHLMVL